MQKPDIIFWLLLPTDQYPPEPIHPTMAAFHHPPAGSAASLLFELSRFLTARADVGREAKGIQKIADFLVIIACVQTHPLWMLGGGLGALDHHTLEGWPRQFHIRAIGARHCQSHGHAMPFVQQAALHPASATERSSRLSAAAKRPLDWRRRSFTVASAHPMWVAIWL